MIFLAGSALLACGCVYRMNIQQGNYLVTESVSQLKEGMTRSQVRFLLGTPMVPDAFDDERWDYYYFYSSKYFKEPLKRRLTVFFADEKVAALRKPGRAHADRPRPAGARPQKAQADEPEERRRSGSACSDATTPAAETTTTPSGSKIEQEAAKPPNPVPPSAPLPAPAGTPSGPT